MTLSVDPLFAPFTVKSLTVPNRFMMGPMTRCFSPDGVPGPDVAAYYERRAKADVGLIVTEGAGIDHPTALGDADSGNRAVASVTFLPSVWRVGPLDRGHP